MADEKRGICGHLHCAKLSYVFKCASKGACSILWRMITQDAPEHDEFELFLILWNELLLCSHVHEANVVKRWRNTLLKHLVNLYRVISEVGPLYT